MALHRKSPSCNSCHRFMDPIGLALDNFDVTGQWRIRENGNLVDAATEFYDGTPMASPSELRDALLQRPTPLLRNFIKNMMAYGLGRRIEYFDMPAVRKIERQAEAEDYRISAIIFGVVRSEAFQMRRMAVAEDTESGG